MSHKKPCQVVLPSETLENIMNQKMLVPTFLNNNETPTVRGLVANKINCTWKL